MEFNVRRAVKADCPRLMQLVVELAVFEKEPDAVTVSPQHFEQSGFGDNPVWWAFVATTTDPSGVETIHGFALYYIRYSTWKGQRLYLEDLIVTEEMRGKGLGKLLFDRVLQETREKKFSGMVWQVLDWNEPAIDFYKKYGAKLDQGWINCSLEL
ncbi:GNAT family N-acetyltransferase [Pseudobacter ginsenosidimutans]|uniref:Ribosomal protein S18 acetylase RimI-like enzyme n=1 Tax=Pseudobacter ginsenosidimutans TaxID=661488 RepID=A0A4Q7MKI8_9BACT|nr:GNAT family N-acetyltransferase [Pseudobacter ginsenosidimutans]QEC40479.1 GNAT family N-acetyltransferase [Pseudobacter ginsenosidimutans]RZS68911.1 ribosomal protein S18 acetylase RimI-like enzyme [Pseudobacter ginsenosidimutans]